MSFGTRRIALLSLCCFFILKPHDAQAAGDDLFRLNVIGTANQVKAGSSSVLNLITDLSNNESQFTPFANQNYTATSNYWIWRQVPVILSVGVLAEVEESSRSSGE